MKDNGLMVKEMEGENFLQKKTTKLLIAIGKMM
jgi:hypothetical protein